MIDLDGFKQINDAYQNHQLGDQVLVTAARVITANLRSMDVAARYGGDEFIVLLPHASAEQAVGGAQRVREEDRLAAGGVPRRQGAGTVAVGIGAARARGPGPGRPA